MKSKWFGSPRGGGRGSAPPRKPRRLQTRHHSSETARSQRVDAGVAYADAGIPSDAPRRPRRDAAREPDGGIPSEFEDETSTSPVAFLPPGGQIALRLDLDRVRQSPARPDVERLLHALPDWQAILGTCGSPALDLSRVFIHTPNLRPRRSCRRSAHAISRRSAAIRTQWLRPRAVRWTGIGRYGVETTDGQPEHATAICPLVRTLCDRPQPRLAAGARLAPHSTQRRGPPMPPRCSRCPMARALRRIEGDAAMAPSPCDLPTTSGERGEVDDQST